MSSTGYKTDDNSSDEGIIQLDYVVRKRQFSNDFLVDQYSSALGQVPGDSFPTTTGHMQATSMGDVIDAKDDEDEDDDESISEQELLKRLSQGQARMEQIKRMLVNQRGFIVESLKKLAANNFGEKPCVNCSSSSNHRGINMEERDRTIGRTMAVDLSKKVPEPEPEPLRTCPMCEASFSPSVSQDDFELHVVEHFNFEESETLRYVPPTSDIPEDCR